MKLSIIVAASKNNVIGVNNKLPWNLPADLKFFKEKTMGHTIIMGRKTFESIGKALPGRKSIVISRQHSYTAEGCIVVQSMEEAILKIDKDETESFIIGGTEIFNISIDMVNRIYLTRINENFEGDSFFGELDKEKWNLIGKEVFEPDLKNKYEYSFEVWDKK